MKIALLLLIITIAAFLVLWVGVRWVEPRMTFYPLKGLTAVPRDLNVSYQSLDIPTDGVQLTAWYLPHPEARAEIIFFHGNAGNLSTWLDFLVSLRSQSYSVTAFDYRGYGDSSGAPTEKGILEDSRSVVEYFHSHLYTSRLPVVYFGRSLGGFTASYAASVREPDGLVLEGAFPSKQSLVRHYPLFRMLNVFSRYRLETTRYLEKVTCPALVIHGDADPVVPISEGRALMPHLSSASQLYVVPGAGHNDTYQVGGEHYWDTLSQFIEGLQNGPNSD